MERKVGYQPPAKNRDWSAARTARSLLLVMALLLSSCLMAAASAERSLSWVAWLSLLPVFITIRAVSPRQALSYGAIWGACLYLFYAISDASAAVSWSKFGLLAAVPAIYIYLGARLTRCIGYTPIVLAVGWILAELALQPVNFHYGLLATTQSDGGLMRIVGGVLGYIFVAFLIAFANAQILTLVKCASFKIWRNHPETVVLMRCGWVTRVAIPADSIIYQRHRRPRAPPCSASCPAVD
jgi:apolipoprotein N-acyltransferase